MSQYEVAAPASGPGTGAVFTLTGTSGGPVSPDNSGNISLISSNSSVVIAGVNATHTLDFQTAVATGSGTAVPATVGGVSTLTIAGGTGITTSAAGSTITITATGAGEIGTIDGDTGSITGSTVTIYANQAALNCGSSVEFANSGTVSTLNLTDSNNNTILGSGAGVSSNTAIQCTALGANALASITDDDTQVAIGYAALQTANDGSGNVGVGAYALNALQAGGDNTAVGAHAGITLASGNFNTMLGYFAGTAYTGAESSNLLISNVGVASESNTIRIGTQGNGNAEQNACYVAGISGVSVSNQQVVTIDTTTGQLGSQATPATQFPQMIFSARLANNASDVTGDGTTYPIVYDTVDINVGSAYNSGTGVFTIPATGYYIFYSGIVMSSLNASHTSANFTALDSAASTGSPYWLGNPYVISEGSNLGLTGTSLTNGSYASGDTVTNNITVTGGTKTVLLVGGASGAGGNAYNFWTCMRIG